MLDVVLMGALQVCQPFFHDRGLVLHKGRTYLRRHTATQILIKTAAA
jgi:hypothetical protein